MICSNVNNEDTISKIANELARIRISQRLSQEELADRLKCSRKLIRCFELNEKTPSFLKILQICDALNVSLGALIVRVEYKTPEYGKLTVIK